MEINSDEKKQVFDLEERLLAYSVDIIKIVEQIPNTRTEGNAEMAETHTAHPCCCKTRAIELFDVGRSMFDVQKKHPPIESARINPRRTLSGSHIRCSMLDVRCSMLKITE
jgi:hypothetical protein